MRAVLSLRFHPWKLIHDCVLTKVYLKKYNKLRRDCHHSLTRGAAVLQPLCLCFRPAKFSAILFNIIIQMSSSHHSLTCCVTMPLGCCRNQARLSRQSHKVNDPTCLPAGLCVFPSAACVCFINSRAPLKAPPGRKRDIHWSSETLFWAFTFTLFYRDLCVCTGSTRSLERSHFIQPASGALFVLLLLSELKLASGSKAALWGGSVRAAGWQCYHKTVQEMSAFHSGQRTVVRLFYRNVPRQQQRRRSRLVEVFLLDVRWREFLCQELIHLSLCMYSHFMKNVYRDCFMFRFFFKSCCYFYFTVKTSVI